MSVKMLSNVLVAFILIFYPYYLVAAEDDVAFPHLKVSNPNEIGYWLYVEECPFTTERMKDVLEGEFLRARIKPRPKHHKDEIFLNVTVLCVNVNIGNVKKGYAMTTDIGFGTRIEGNTMLYWFPEFGGIFISDIDSDYLINRVKSEIESALTAFLKENI